MFKQGIGFHFNVSSCEATIAFYTEKLGFKLLYHDKNGKQALVSTNTKDCMIGFAENQPVVSSSTCITFEVENIEYSIQTLKQNGVTFTGGIIEVPGAVKLTSFTDPDGYNLMLSERIGK